MARTLADWATILIAMEDALSVPTGGFVVDPVTGRDVFEGYAVFVHPKLTKIINGRVTVGQLCQFIAAAGDALDEPGRMIIGRRDPDTGDVHLDVCLLVAHRNEARDTVRRGLGLFDVYRWVRLTVASAA